ncbi:hypothetical protein TNCV_3261091 [Trichonephila clavipes]|nr:hypothetical protein TNCV_3261091 [Trichonephila clavipes]
MREKTSSFWCAFTHHGVQQGRQCSGHLANTRHGSYLEYTQNIVIQHQGEDPTGKPLICSTNPTSMSLRGHRREYLSVVWTGKEEKEEWDDKKRVENREGSLEYPGFVKPVFTKDSKPHGKRKRSLGHLGIVAPILT